MERKLLLSAIVILVCLVGCQPASTAPDTPNLPTAAPVATMRPATVTPTSLADVTCAHVLFVLATEAMDGTWSFDVTVQHRDTGWEHYADAWDVLSPAGDVLATRALTHPHVEEQPFTRSLAGVKIPAAITTVHVRAHDLMHGYCGKKVAVDLNQPEGADFEVARREGSARQLRAVQADKPPQIDGLPEPAWDSAPAVTIPLTHGAQSDEPAYAVEMRALYDAESLYLLARWPDDAPARQDADINKMTVHWRIEQGAIHCAVACHTAYVAGDLTVRSLNAETIPQGPAEMLPAAGGWHDGEWIIEWSRPLILANAYDLQFRDLHLSYPFLVKVFESIPNQPDPISSLAELVFQ